VGSTLGVLVGSLLVVVSIPGPAGAAACSITWDGGGDGTSWTDNTNWVGDIGVPGAGDVVCITTTDHVAIDGLQAGVAEVQLGGSSELEVKDGASLLVDNGTDSVWGPGTNVAINNGGSLGGTGTIRVQGGIFFASPNTGSVLTSGAGGNGHMVVEGHALVVANGLGVEGGYQVDVAAGGSLALAANTWMAAQPGTTTTIRAGATLELTGDGGFYRSSAAGQGALTNNGVLRKSGGTGTSVVDAAYSGSGQVVVQTGTLALPDGGLVGAVVSPGSALATGRCAGASTGSTCQPTQDPAADPMSVNLTVPGANGSATAVQVQELGPVGAGVDPNGVGNEVLAHADNLVADSAHPATITLRYSQADVMGTPLDEVQVVHTTDDLQQVLLPDCVNGALPGGLWSCVQRPVTRNGQNTFVTVLTTQTSRWRVRRSLPVANQGAPTAPRAVTVKEAKPFDGSVLNVSWTVPASSGAGAVAAYRVFVDGKLKASPAGTSAMVKNAGPGKHTIKVAAVNAAGTSPTGSDAIKLAALSKPRKVEAQRGKAGAPSTVTLEWKAPADAGGFILKKYEVAIFKGDRKVDTEKLSAKKRKVVLTLSGGQYTFRVRAKNSDRWGPWSKPSDPVRPR
jgi:hypothetical protein